MLTGAELAEVLARKDKRGQCNRRTSERDEEMVRAYLSGVGAQALATAYSVNVKRVYEVMHEYRLVAIYRAQWETERAEQP